jgi:hypothetical protein
MKRKTELGNNYGVIEVLYHKKKDTNKQKRKYSLLVEFYLLF